MQTGPAMAEPSPILEEELDGLTPSEIRVIELRRRWARAWYQLRMLKDAKAEASQTYDARQRESRLRKELMGAALDLTERRTGSGVRPATRPSKL